MPNPLVLYSINSLLAYRIAERYYNQEHYVWCSPFFNARMISSIDSSTPPTSNPSDIYWTLHEEVENGDRHSAKVKENKVGVLKGATFKRQAGVISAEQESEIASIVAAAETSDFRPLLYIIPFVNAADILKEVPVKERAHPLSIEYVIENLPRHKFDILLFDRR